MEDLSHAFVCLNGLSPIGGFSHASQETRRVRLDAPSRVPRRGVSDET